MGRKIFKKVLGGIFITSAIVAGVSVFLIQKNNEKVTEKEPTISFTNLKEHKSESSKNSAKAFEKTISKPTGNIEEILETEDYKDLPEEAKDLIRQNYAETKTVILTEKNKVEGKPYLNSKYVNYLENGEKNGALIPEAFLIDYDTNNKVGSSTLPSKYDLRNVNNKKYITGLKNQNELGICWAFASVEQAESYLMMRDETYYENPKLLSTRQMDYATAKNTFDGFDNIEATEVYDNDENMDKRVLGDGGNYFYSSIIMSRGLSLVSEIEKEPWKSLTWTKNELSLYPKLDKSEILNYGNSLYEVNSTITFPMLNLSELDQADPTDQQIRELFLNTLKENIMEYGGLYVGTQAPGYTCSAQNSVEGNYKGTYIIRDDGHCVEDAGHAMQVIGWDDNYEYSYKYCAGSGEYAGKEVHNYNSATCKNGGQTVSGTGAWLIRNSWGDGTAANYVWLAYDSMNDDFAVATDIEKTSEKTWDNLYRQTMSNYIGYVVASDVVNIASPEKLQKIKFMAEGNDATYYVIIYDGDAINDNPSTIASYIVEAEYSGYQTLDLSSENIILDEGPKTVFVADYGCLDGSGCSSMIYSNSVDLYTQNVSREPSIKTENNSIAIAESEMVAEDEYYGFRIYSTTKNIPSNSEISYQLYNSKNENVTNEYIHSLKYNVVATNDVYPEIVIKGTLPIDTYVLEISYGDAKSEMNILVGYDHIPAELELSCSDENYDADEKIIDKIPVGTTVNELLNKFDTNDDYHVEFEGDYVGTGAKIKIIDYMGKVVDEISIVIRGDVSGDGDIDPLDYVKIRKYIMSQTTLEGIYNRAADYNDDGEIDVLDYVKIRKLIMLN